MSVTSRIVIDTNGHGLAALQRRLRAGVQRVLVGVPAGPVDPDGTPLAQVGAYVEFGTVTSPERPFLRGGVASAVPKIRELARHDLRAVAEGGMTIPAALDRQGQLAAGAVKAYMAGPNFAPNAPSTIAKKGSAQPTIDIGQLRQAVTSVVETT